MSITDIEIAVDREIEQFLTGATALECENCGAITYRGICPLCPSMSVEGLRTGDPAIDDILARKERGEKVSLGDYFMRTETGEYRGKAYDLDHTI